MKIKNTPLPGCFQILPDVISDSRGRFIKTFHTKLFYQYGLRTDFVEEYYTTSYAGVLRGLHFQIPPHEHAKLVYCVFGEVLDAIVDLRIDSPTYRQHAVVNLNAEEANMIYIDSGVAHGFYVQSNFAILVYNVTSIYSPEHDAGILWSSADIPWPDTNPIISPRDKAFVPLTHFKSPFRFIRR